MGNILSSVRRRVDNKNGTFLHFHRQNYKQYQNAVLGRLASVFIIYTEVISDSFVSLNPELAAERRRQCYFTVCPHRKFMRRITLHESIGWLRRTIYVRRARDDKIAMTE